MELALVHRKGRRRAARGSGFAALLVLACSEQLGDTTATETVPPVILVDGMLSARECLQTGGKSVPCTELPRVYGAEARSPGMQGTMGSGLDLPHLAYEGDPKFKTTAVSFGRRFAPAVDCLVPFDVSSKDKALNPAAADAYLRWPFSAMWSLPTDVVAGTMAVPLATEATNCGAMLLAAGDEWESAAAMSTLEDPAGAWLALWRASWESLDYIPWTQQYSQSPKSLQVWTVIPKFEVVYPADPPSEVIFKAYIARYLAAHDLMYDERPYGESTNEIVAPGLHLDPDTAQRFGDPALHDHHLARFLAIAGAKNKLPKIINFRTRAASSAQLLATAATVRTLADKAGWPKQQQWRRTIAVQHVAIQPGVAATPDPRVLAWRRTLLGLAAAVRVMDGVGEETFSFHVGTVTSTLEPLGALRPADLTTSGWPSEGPPRDHTTAKWRAASWPLWVIQQSLWDIYVTTPTPHCIAYGNCGVKPEPGKYDHILVGRAPIALELEGIDAAGPWRAPNVDSGVSIVAMREPCRVDGEPEDCFARGERALRPFRTLAGDAATAPGRSVVVRALVVDERDSVAAATPTAGILRLRLQVPAGVTSVRLRSATMPPPQALFDEVEVAEPRNVEVVDGVATLELPATRPGAVLLEAAY